MKNTEDLTLQEIEFAFGVIMDSELQNQIMSEQDHKDSWALDYVYDSELREKLEKIYQVRLLQQNLAPKENKFKINKI